MYPVLIQLGTFELRSYGVIVALSFLLGLWLSTGEAKRKGLDPGLVQNEIIVQEQVQVDSAGSVFVASAYPAQAVLDGPQYRPLQRLR